MKTPSKHILFPYSLALALLAVLFLPGCGDSSPKGADTGGSDAAETAPGNAEAGGFTLTTDIPPEVLEGTPMPVEVPNLEPQPRSVPTLQVPEGTELLSRDKSVTSSDDFPIIGDLSYVTDGDKDGGEGYYVELMNGLQWVQIDLEEEAQIEAVWIWHFHSQLRAYQDVIVQVSNDPAFESGVTTLYNNDFDNSAGLGRGNDRPYIESRFGKLIDGNGTRARYVRLYSNGNTANDMNHYTEVEVYGRR